MAKRLARSGLICPMCLFYNDCCVKRTILNNFEIYYLKIISAYLKTLNNCKVDKTNSRNTTKRADIEYWKSFPSYKGRYLLWKCIFALWNFERTTATFSVKKYLFWKCFPLLDYKLTCANWLTGNFKPFLFNVPC